MATTLFVMGGWLLRRPVLWTCSLLGMGVLYFSSRSMVDLMALMNNNDIFSNTNENHNLSLLMENTTDNFLVQRNALKGIIMQLNSSSVDNNQHYHFPRLQGNHSMSIKSKPSTDSAATMTTTHTSHPIDTDGTEYVQALAQPTASAYSSSSTSSIAESYIAPAANNNIDQDHLDFYGTTQINDTVSLPVIPLRSDANKQLAQDCVRQAQGGVYLKHFRKAAGTTMYQFIQRNVCRRGIPTYASELPFFMPEQTFDLFLGTGTNSSSINDAPSLNSSVVFVTSLRDPIERIVSLYWFEGRWPRTCSRKCEARKVKDDSTKVADLAEWIEQVNDQNNTKALGLRRHAACGQWMSVSDYYIRMLLGIDRVTNKDPPAERRATKYRRGFRNVTLTRYHLHRAKEVLASFDLVLIVEHLQRQDLATMFQTITGGGENGSLVEGPLSWARHGSEKASTEPQDTKPSPTELKRLQELNALDMELYEYAVGLSERTVERWTKQQQKQQQQQHDDREQEGEETALATLTPLWQHQCRKPPLYLNEEQRFIAIGGEGCGNGHRVLYQSGCLQHSREGSY
jgi:Sulfotransferase family